MSDKGKEEEEDLSSSLDVEVDPYASLVGGGAGAFSVPDDDDEDDSPNKKRKGAPMTTSEILNALSGRGGAGQANGAATRGSNEPDGPPDLVEASLERSNAEMLAKLLTRARMGQPEDKRDGAHVANSDGKGAGPCGKLHWFEGKQVDYCFKLAGRYIGFNRNENTLTLADDFIEKHNLMKDQTSVSQLRNEITSIIRSAIATNSKDHEDEDIVDLIDNAKIFDPFQDGFSDGEIIRPHMKKNGMATVTNRNTGKTEHIMYRNDADETRIQAQKERQAAAIAQAQKEQDSRRAEIMARFKAQHAEKKSHQSSAPSPSPVKAKALSGRIPPQSRMATLDSLGRVNAVPKEKWLDLQYGLDRLIAVNDDNQKLKEEMLASGFVMAEIAAYFQKLQLFIIMKNYGGAGAGAQDEGDEFEDGDAALLAGASSAVKTPVKAFGGQGYSMTDSQQRETPEGEAGGLSVDEEHLEDPEQEEQATLLVVDSSAALTKIQVRTLSGERLVIQCNVTTTVADLRSHLIAVAGRPQRSFLLMQQRPTKILTDLGATVGSAQLQGGALMMKLK